MLQNFGVSEMPTNGSLFGVTLDDDDGTVKSLEFEWEFPIIEENI